MYSAMKTSCIEFKYRNESDKFLPQLSPLVTRRGKSVCNITFKWTLSLDKWITVDDQSYNQLQKFTHSKEIVRKQV